jgi:DNA transformation protein
MEQSNAGSSKMKRPDVKKRLEYILSKLKPHGPITARAMFGGYGIYYGKIIFASLVEGKLYFRVDEMNEKDYQPYNSKPFIFEGGKRPAVMPYLTLPEEILENPRQLPQWIEKARQASLRYRRRKK